MCVRAPTPPHPYLFRRRDLHVVSAPRATSDDNDLDRLVMLMCVLANAPHSHVGGELIKCKFGGLKEALLAVLVGVKKQNALFLWL